MSTYVERRPAPPPTKPRTRRGSAWIAMFFSIIFLIAGRILYTDFYLTSDSPPNFEVDSITVYPFNVTTYPILVGFFATQRVGRIRDANWNILFSVKNSRIDNVYFDDVKGSVLYKGEDLTSSVTIKPFLVNKRYKKTMVKADIGVQYKDINSSIADAMVEDWVHGAVNFTVKLDAIARSDWDDDKLMTISCEDLQVGFASNTSTGTLLTPGNCNSKFN